MMTKLSQRLVLLLTAIVVMTMSACAHPAGEATPETPAQGDTIAIMSQAMGRDIKNVVIVPSQYFDKNLQEQRYPVLYLLHGAFGCYSDWPLKARLDSLSNEYGIIIVCPDGQDSWYVDSPVDPKMQFETYVSKELVAYIDKNYRTIAHRYMRAITGLSMGGHGAISLTFKHPDVFWSCGSMSGNMDITQYPEKWFIKDRLGNYEENKQVWKDHAVCNLVDQLKASPLQPAPNIVIDEGLKDIFYKNNLALHDQLVEKGIDHEFYVRPGAHTWTYWINALDYHMLFFSKAFARGAQLIEQEKAASTNEKPE